MAETFSVVITTLGLAEIAAAIASASVVTLDNFSVGDSNGSYYEPSEGQTSLINQQYISALSTLVQDGTNPNWLIATGIIPADGVGGWYVREAGIWSSTGNLFAVAKIPATYKPSLSAGSGKDLVIKITMEVTNTSVVTLEVDPESTVATKEYVDGFAKYLQYKFNDCVTCAEATNPLGDSGDATNPYGISLSNLKPSTGTERIFVYVTEHKSDGRLLTNDPRVFTQGDVDNFGRPDVLGSISEQIGLAAPKSVSNKNTVYLESNTILYCTFKGTGLVLRWSPAILVTTDIEYSLDGGTWTTISYSNATMTSLDRTDTLGITNTVAEDETYGEHTVRVRIKSTSNYSNVRIIGFDVLSDYDSIQVSSGEYFINGQYLANITGGDLTPSTIGSNNHRRDRIAIGDDLIIQLITGTAIDTPKYYEEASFNTERAKEELKNIYDTSDFFESNVIVKTLGDGVTNFQADVTITNVLTTGIDLTSDDVPWVDTYALGSDVNFKFTFVGTGCDAVLRLEDIGGSTTGVVMNIYVDEVLKGTLTESDFQNVESASGDSYLSYSLCTGLPYGSHTVRLEAKNAGATDNWALYVKSFSTYQAKTPDLLDDHIDLGCTNLTPSDGWITYSPSQAKYLGSQWQKLTSVGESHSISTRVHGYSIECLTGDTTGDTCEFIFTGTSVVWLGHSGNDDGKVKVYLDGTVLTTSHPDWATITVTTTMPASWVNTTGIVDCYEVGSDLVSEREGIKITGLSEGLHTIKLEGSGKNASSSDYNIPVHGFQVIPLNYVLDSEQNWEENFNNIGRNCSAVKRDSKIKELEQGKQDQSDVLDTVVSESLIESGHWEDSLLDPSTPFTANTTRVFTVPFRTKKIATPVVIIVNSGSEAGAAASITQTNFRVTNTADQSTEFPDIIIDWTAIAQ